MKKYTYNNTSSNIYHKVMKNFLTKLLNASFEKCLDGLGRNLYKNTYLLVPVPFGRFLVPMFKTVSRYQPCSPDWIEVWVCSEKSSISECSFVFPLWLVPSSLAQAPLNTHQHSLRWTEENCKRQTRVRVRVRVWTEHCAYVSYKERRSVAYSPLLHTSAPKSDKAKLYHFISSDSHTRSAMYLHMESKKLLFSGLFGKSQWCAAEWRNSSLWYCSFLFARFKYVAT